MIPLIALSAGPLMGGLRHPAAWSVIACALWASAPRDAIRHLPAAPLWLAWLAWTFLSAILSPEPLRSLGAAGEGATALLLLAWAARAGNAERKAWLLGLLAWAPLLAAAAFWMTGHAAMTGLLPPYYNYTASFEAAACTAAVAVLCGAPAPGAGARGHLERALAAVAALAAFVELCTAGSRGAALACAAGVGLTLWRAGRKRVIVGLGAAVLGAAALAPSASRDAWFKPDRPGANRRPSIWSSAVSTANEHPALGTGPGRFEQGFLKHAFPSDVHTAHYNLTTSHAHSEGLQAAAETGWIGLALLLAALWATARPAFVRTSARAAPRGGGADVVGEASLAAVVALSVQGLFDNILALGWLRLVYFSALGMLTQGVAHGEGRGRSVPSREQPVGSASLWWRGACLAGLLAAAWGRWPGWIAERARERADAAPPDQARRILAQARRVLPTEPGLLEALARAALRQSPPDGAAAERALQTVREASPYRAAYPQMLAEIAVTRRDWEAALRLSREASSIEPEFLEARLVEAEALTRLGLRAQALEAVDRLEEARKRLTGRIKPQNSYDELISYLDARRRRELLQRLKIDEAAAGQQT